MAENIAFDIAVFISGLFVLDYGADTFIDHTVKVASRMAVSPTLISLISAGAEFDELAVVVAAVAQNRSSLALGNILGSAISNILGAFSLGLIVSADLVVFDRSAKIYTSVLFALTSAFTLALVCFKSLGRIGGVVLIAAFFGYMLSIGYCIFKGVLSPPENDDDDSDSESDSDSDSDDENEEKQRRHRRSWSINDEEASRHATVSLVAAGAATTSLALDSESDHSSLHNVPLVSAPAPARSRSLIYHVWKLMLGLAAISLAGYILSGSVTRIGDAYSLSGGLLGTTVLSLATTLPEKIVAVVSSSRRQSGIVVANTVGSNIFLLTLCCGVLFAAGNLDMITAQLDWFTVGAVWASSLLLFGIVMVGARRWMGLVLFALYMGFLAAEFILYGTTDRD